MKILKDEMLECNTYEWNMCEKYVNTKMLSMRCEVVCEWEIFFLHLFHDKIKAVWDSMKWNDYLSFFMTLRARKLNENDDVELIEVLFLFVVLLMTESKYWGRNWNLNWRCDEFNCFWTAGIKFLIFSRIFKDS